MVRLKIRWFGHACFGLTASDDTKFLTDPFDESVGYLPPRIEVSTVTVSHGHFDHSCTQELPGQPQILREAGEHQMGSTTIRTIRTYHDANGGRSRGENLMFHFTDAGLHLLHAGDLGHVLSAEQILACGRVDVFLVPIGGTYTLDAEDAWRVADQLKPSLVIPMHYRTDALAFPLAPVDQFLRGRLHERLAYATIEVTAETLPAQREIKVLSYI